MHGWQHGAFVFLSFFWRIISFGSGSRWQRMRAYIDLMDIGTDDGCEDDVECWNSCLERIAFCEYLCIPIGVKKQPFTNNMLLLFRQKDSKASGSIQC